MSSSEKLKILNDVLGNYIKDGKEIVYHCPLCNHHKNKLSINVDKNAFKCWVCDYRGRNLRRLVRRFGSYRDLQKWDALTGRPDLSDFDKIFDQPNQEENIKLSLPEEFVSLTSKNLSVRAIEAKQYLYERGLTNADIAKWKIGFCYGGEYSGRVVVPSFNMSGELDFYVGRTFREHRNKYKNPKSNKNLVFNELYIDWDSDLTIVEGVFDAIVADNSVPILGSTLTKNSRIIKNIVKYDTTVFLALDDDAKKKELSIIETLSRFDIEMYKIDTSGFDDVGSMTKEEFQKRKNNAKFVNIDNYIIMQKLMEIK